MEQACSLVYNIIWHDANRGNGVFAFLSSLVRGGKGPSPILEKDRREAIAYSFGVVL